MSKTLRRLQQEEPARVSRAELGWNKSRSLVAAIASADRVSPNVDLQLAGSAMLAGVDLLRSDAYRDRLAKLASIGEVSADLCDRAGELAWGCVHARRMQLQTAGTASMAKVAPELAQRSLELRDRMFALVEYYFGNDEELGALVAFIREGSGYLDRANDLESLADLYHRRAEAVAKDVKNFRASDEADARTVADQLYRALGAGSSKEASAWLDEQSALWPLALRAWSEVMRAGRFLAPMGQADELFPSLVTAARGLSPKSVAAKPEPVVPVPVPG